MMIWLYVWQAYKTNGWVMLMTCVDVSDEEPGAHHIVP